jgi:hypothetical protein
MLNGGMRSPLNILSGATDLFALSAIWQRSKGKTPVVGLMRRMSWEA